MFEKGLPGKRGGLVLTLTCSRWSFLHLRSKHKDKLVTVKKAYSKGKGDSRLDLAWGFLSKAEENAQA